VTSHVSAQLQVQMQTTIFVHKFHFKFKQNPVIFFLNMAKQPSFKAVNSINQGSAPVPHTRSSAITLEIKCNLSPVI